MDWRRDGPPIRRAWLCRESSEEGAGSHDLGEHVAHTANGRPVGLFCCLHTHRLRSTGILQDDDLEAAFVPATPRTLYADWSGETTGDDGLFGPLKQDALELGIVESIELGLRQDQVRHGREVERAVVEFGPHGGICHDLSDRRDVVLDSTYLAWVRVDVAGGNNSSTARFPGFGCSGHVLDDLLDIGHMHRSVTNAEGLL